MAVLGHFYEGRRVRDLVRSFLDWQVELNLETADFFRELVVACDGAKGAEDPALLRAVDSIARRELPAREARLRRLCDFRGALDRFANASVASGRRVAVAPPASRLRMPRHAAAVAAAIGMFGCAVAHDRGIQEAAPPPIDPRPPPVPPPPVGEDGTLPPYREDLGVAEAAPPPYDRYRHDDGIMEAAPPPYDAGAPILARLRLTARQDHGPTARIDSAAPLVVRYRGNTGKTPWTSSLHYRPGSHSITLENPATGDKLVVHLTLSN